MIFINAKFDFWGSNWYRVGIRGITQVNWAYSVLKETFVIWYPEIFCSIQVNYSWVINILSITLKVTFIFRYVILLLLHQLQHMDIRWCMFVLTQVEFCVNWEYTVSLRIIILMLLLSLHHFGINGWMCLMTEKYFCTINEHTYNTFRRGSNEWHNN